MPAAQALAEPEGGHVREKRSFLALRPSATFSEENVGLLLQIQLTYNLNSSLHVLLHYPYITLEHRILSQYYLPTPGSGFRMYESEKLKFQGGSGNP